MASDSCKKQEAVKLRIVPKIENFAFYFWCSMGDVAVQRPRHGALNVEHHHGCTSLYGIHISMNGLCQHCLLQSDQNWSAKNHFTHIVRLHRRLPVIFLSSLFSVPPPRTAYHVLKKKNTIARV